MKDPWKLSPQQIAAMDAYIREGCAKRAAASLGVAKQTLSVHTSRAKSKMKVQTLLLALIQWDRFRRGDKDQSWGVVI